MGEKINLNVSDPGIELGYGVCHFEKVPPDQEWVRVESGYG